MAKKKGSKAEQHQQKIDKLQQKIDGQQTRWTGQIAQIPISTTTDTTTTSWGSSLPFNHQIKVGLSAEELTELEFLEKGRKEETKLKRINYFKSLASQIRQQICDYAETRLAMHTISQYETMKSPRQVELENQKPVLYGTGSLSFGNYSRFDADSSSQLGLTSDELKQAHADATLEEMLTSDPNRNDKTT